MLGSYMRVFTVMVLTGKKLFYVFELYLHIVDFSSFCHFFFLCLSTDVETW